MKMLRLVFMTCCLLAFSSAQSDVYAVNKVRINGMIKGLKPVPGKLYLFLDQRLSDSTAVRNGRYQFTCGVTGVAHVLIKETRSFVPDGHMAISLLINKGVINVESDRFLSHVTLSGTGAQAAIQYREAIKKTLLLTDTLNNFISGDAYHKNELLRADVRIKTSFLAESMTQQMMAYLKQYPASAASAYMAVAIYEYNYPVTSGIEQLLKRIPARQQAWVTDRIITFKKKKQAEALAKQNKLEAAARRNQELAEKTATGKTAIEFSQSDTAGNVVSLSSFRGKYVLIDFWASWCGPCRAENPVVVKAYHAYKEKGFTILGVSMDSSKQNWLAAIRKDGLNWTQVSDLKGWDNNVGKLYNVKGIPANFLLDPNGIIIAKDLRGEALETKLAELFNH